MKKTSCVFAFLFAMVISVFALNSSVGFAEPMGKTDDAMSTESTHSSHQLTFGKDIYDICNFENPSDLRKIEYQNYFGKWSYNNDAKYVRNGKGSLKISPQGYGLGTEGYYGSPMMRIYPEAYKQGNKDFTKVEYIAFDVYNASLTDETIKFAFMGKVANSKIYQQSSFKDFLIKTNRWTRCFYPLPYETFSLTYDLQEIRELVFKFTPKYYKEELPVLYIDNITMKKTNEHRESLPIELDQNEFCNFEKEYQLYTIQGSEMFTPILEITEQAQYVTSGSKALKVTMPHGVIQNKSWPSFQFSDSLVKKANLGQYNAKNHSLKFDCYNTQDIAMKFFIKFLTENPKRPEQNVTTVLFVAKPGKNTCAISLDKVNELGFYKGQSVTMIQELSQIRVDWGEFSGSDRVFYFDNFRVEQDV